MGNCLKGASADDISLLRGNEGATSDNLNIESAPVREVIFYIKIINILNILSHLSEISFENLYTRIFKLYVCKVYKNLKIEY